MTESKRNGGDVCVFSQIIKDFYLLGRGELYQVFIDLAQHMLKTPPTAVTEHGEVSRVGCGAASLRFILILQLLQHPRQQVVAVQQHHDTKIQLVVSSRFWAQTFVFVTHNSNLFVI